MNISPINSSYKNVSPKFGNSEGAQVCRTQVLTETLAKVPKLLETVVTAYEANETGEVDESGSTVYKGTDPNGNFYFESRTKDNKVYIGNGSQQLVYNLNDATEPITMFTDTKGDNVNNFVTFNPVNKETRVFLDDYGQTVFAADGKRYDFNKSSEPVENKCNFIA